MIQIDEYEWEQWYDWLPTDEDGNCELLDSVPDDIDDRYVWTQVDSWDHDGYVIVPGRCVGAIGHYITRLPHDYDVAVDMPPPDEGTE